MIRKMFLAGSYDLKALEEFLEEQAAKGFMFVKQRGIFYYFEKCEPKKVHFAVDVFEKASIFDTRPEAKTEEYIEYCEQCGWKFLFTNGKIQFFYTEKENPVDIQTDDELKLKIIHKNMMVTRGASWLSLVFVLLMQILSGVFREFTGANMVDQFIVFGGNLPLIIAYIGIIVSVSMEMLRYNQFYKKNKKRVQNGQKIQYVEKKKVEKYHKVTCILYLCFAICMLISLCSLGKMGYVFAATILVSIVFMYLLEFFRQGNKKMSRQDNVIFTIVFSVIGCGICITGSILVLFIDFFDFNSQKVKYYDEEEKCYVYMTISEDEIPLTMEELGIITEGVEYHQTTAFNYRSIFGEYHMYEQMYFDKEVQDIGPLLSYEIVNSSWDKLLDSYVDEYLEQSFYECKDITKEEGELWGADMVYSLWDKELKGEGRLVIYKDKVMYIICEELQYNENTISMVKQALDLN